MGRWYDSKGVAGENFFVVMEQFLMVIVVVHEAIHGI